MLHFVDLILNNVFYPKHNRCCLNPVDDEGRPLKSIVDNSPSKACFLNEFGWISNDFSLLEKAKTDTERQMLLNRLLEVSRMPSSSGLSDDQILSDIVPRGMRDPVDYERYMSSVLDTQARSYLAEQRRIFEEESKKISFEENKE